MRVRCHSSLRAERRSSGTLAGRPGCARGYRVNQLHREIVTPLDPLVLTIHGTHPIVPVTM